MRDHRWKKRRQVSLDVVVRGRNGPPLHGKVRDISTEGMFIQLAPQAIPARIVVEIEITPCGWLHGWVVHAGGDGIGVMFLSTESGERCLLKQMLSA